MMLTTNLSFFFVVCASLTAQVRHSNSNTAPCYSSSEGPSEGWTAEKKKQKFCNKLLELAINFTDVIDPSMPDLYISGT